jgi:site-specific recombinase XerD
MTTSTISPLRQRMIEDMNARNLCEGTQRGHIRACKRFAALLKRSPDTAEADDVRRFQLHLMEDGASIQTRNRTMTGLRFLLRVTLRRHDLAAEVYHLKEPVNLPLTLSQEQARRLITVAGRMSLRLRLMLALGYACGLRASEVVRLKAGDIDSAQGIIRVVQSKGCKDRHVMLPEEVLDLLRQWWKERPARSDAGVPPQERLVFSGRKAGKPLTTRHLNRLFHEACDAAGIKKRVTLHSLRHYLPSLIMSGSFDRNGKRLKNRNISCRNARATRHSQRGLQAVQEFQQIVIGPEAGCFAGVWGRFCQCRFLHR